MGLVLLWPFVFAFETFFILVSFLFIYVLIILVFLFFFQLTCIFGDIGNGFSPIFQDSDVDEAVCT